MKKILPYLLVSTVTAVCTVGIYHACIVKEIKDTMKLEKVGYLKGYEVALSENVQLSRLSSAPTDFSDAAERTRDAVVAIRATDSNSDRLGISSGSGVIFTSDGYIATNHHVVKNAEYVLVTLNNQKTFKAKVLGSDESTDLALLKIESDNLIYVEFGNSDSLRVGEWVMAIGNPFMLQSTVTAGIVSAKARSLNILERQGIESFIQYYAAVKQLSGVCDFINTRGQLVGINTAILSQTGNYEGYSFAIPSNIARKVLKDLIEFGVVQRGWLGIEISNIDEKTAEGSGLSEVVGVLAVSVGFKGAAYDAGIRNGDVIVSIQNVKVSSVPEFMEQIAKYRPGDEVALVYYRNKKAYTTKAILRNQLNTISFIAALRDKVLEDIGIEIRDLDEQEISIVNTGGVYVVSVSKNSPAGKSSMEPGYIIKTVNNQKVSNARELIEMFKSLRGKVVLIEGFYLNYPGEYPYTFSIPY